MGRVRMLRFLNEGISSSVRGTSSTLLGSGRRAYNCDNGPCCGIGMVGDGTRGVAEGVTTREDRGLFLDLGLEGTCRKSSGMSFQLSIVGTAVEDDGTRLGAEDDLGGGGGRLGLIADVCGGFETSSFFAGAPAAFLSHPLSEDCSIVGSQMCSRWA